MNWVIEAMIAGVIAFTATNVDDLLILTLFFGRADGVLRRRHIIVGRYLSLLGLVIASLPGFLGGMVIPQAWLGWLGILPVAIGIHHLLQPDTHGTTLKSTPLAQRSPVTKPTWRSHLASIISPYTYQVAAVTFANGGDNIGIYVPLFANSTLASLSVILGVFVIMTGLWCVAAAQLARHPLFARILSSYGHRLVPFVLIGLGIFIFIDSGTYQLLGK